MAKQTKLQILEKGLFKAVYGWGRWGVVTDEGCNTFQDYMQKYREAVKAEIIVITLAQASLIRKALENQNSEEIEKVKEHLDTELLKI